MRFGIDVTSYLASRTGVGVCLGELVRTLLSETSDNDQFVLCAFSRKKRAIEVLQQAFPAGNRGVRVRRAPVRVVRRLADRLPFLTVERLFGSFDLFHASHLLVPVSRSVPIVTTVYDLTPVLYPGFHLPSNLFTAAELRRWIERTDLVIVPSAHTAQDLQNLVAFPPEKMRTIPLGVKPCFRPLGGMPLEAITRFGLEGPFLLTVGSLEPRKNLGRLMEAFLRLRERHKIPHRLVVAGPKGWMEQPIYEAAAKRGLGSSVVFTGFVSDEELNELYNGAELLVYPSLYEGFGLPPLEAMAAGCPVAVSRVSSLPEVVGAAGVYFDPLQEDDIAERVLALLESRELRSNLIEAGLKRAAEFTWKQTACATLGAYRAARAIRAG